MKEKTSVSRRLLALLRSSAMKVNPKAKKSFRASLKGRGMSARQIRAVTRKRKTAARTAADPRGERTAVDRVAALAKVGSQLRITR